MYSVRLARRQQFVDEKYPLEQMGSVNRSGQIPLISSSHRKSRQRDRRYARDLISQSISEWLQDSQKSSKKKRRSRRQSTSLSKKRHPANQQTRCDPSSSMPPIHRSATSAKTIREKAENLHELYSSSFPTRLTADHLTLQKDSLHKDYRLSRDIPQTLSISLVTEGKQCSCQITMTYRSDPILSVVSHNVKRDEVTIFQEANDGYTSVVFKGFLKAGDKFAFKSQRSVNDRFQLIICINDLVDSRISSCCEFKYRNGVRIGGKDGLFWIHNIAGAKSCRKCREDTNTSSRSHSIDDRKMSPSSWPRVSSRLKLPVIYTDQSTPETKLKSATSDRTSEDIFESRIVTARDIPDHVDEFRSISFTSQSTVPLPAGNRPSSSLSTTDLKWPAQESAKKSNSKQSLSESTIPKDSESAPVPAKGSSPLVAVSEKKIEKDNEHITPLIQVEMTNNQTTFFQSLMALIQQAMSPLEPQIPIPPRDTGNVENFSIAWIGKSEETDMVLLRHVVNFIHVFDDIDALNTFLTECIHSKIIVLLSYNKAQAIISQIHNITCVYSIYLLSTDKHKQSNWTKDYHKIAGVYRTIELIRDHLLKTLPQVSSLLIPVIIAANGSTSDIPFIYCQLLKETMLCNDDESDLKKDMLEFCRFHYAKNQDEMNNIDEFEKEITPNKVIWWYTRNSFIAKILNRALRTQEIDLLYKMRYAMQCLHTHIKSIAINEVTIVYVVLKMSLDKAMELQENINGLLLFGAYLPALLKRPESLNFNEDNEQICIIFSINLGPGCGARITQLCSSDSKIDILVNIDTVFRIRSVEKESNRHLNVNLESVNHTDHQFKQLTEPLRSEIKAPVVLLQVTKLLLATNHYAECDYLAELLFTDQSLRGDPTLLASLAAVHHLLGNTDDERGDAKAARKQFFKSLRAFQSFLPPDHPLMSASYNNVGSMYFKDNEYDKAITFHQKALDCQLKSPSPDTDAIATYSNNIGAVYFEQEKYTDALKYLQRAATILEKFSLPEKILNLCVIYQKLAASYWRMDKPKEALEYYKKTLDIQLIFLPPTAHQISVTYFNLSTAYARLGQIDDAVTSAEKSVEQLLKIYPPDHPEVKENQAQLEIVRQKQWLQQVLSS